MTGNVREVRRVIVGDEYTAEDSPGGFFLKEASEPGYFFRLAFGVAFVSEAQIAEANRVRADSDAVRDVAAAEG